MLGNLSRSLVHKVRHLVAHSSYEGSKRVHRTEVGR